MLKKSKLYLRVLPLFLGGIMFFNSCLGCRNTPKRVRIFHKEEHERTTPYHDNNQFTTKRPVWASTLLEQKKAFLTAKDEQGRNPIQHIIYHGTTSDELEAILQKMKGQFPDEEIANQEIAKLLNTPDNSPRKDTAFIGAVEKMGEKRDKNLIKLINVLFEHGARPSPEERKRGLLYCIKLSGLETSATNSGIDLFKHLVEEFQKNNLLLDQATAVAVASAAARTGNDHLMQYILEHSDIFPLDATSNGEQNNSLLHYATSGGRNSTYVIDLLLAKFDSPDVGYINQVNADGESALHLAVRHTSVDAVRALVKAGANTSLKSGNGKTILDIANELIEQQPTNNQLRAIQRIILHSVAATGLEIVD